MEHPLMVTLLLNNISVFVLQLETVVLLMSQPTSNNGKSFGLQMGNLYEVKILAEVGSDRSTSSGSIDFPYAKVYTVSSSSSNHSDTTNNKNYKQLFNSNQFINTYNTNFVNDTIYYTYDNITNCDLKKKILFIFMTKKKF